jgi:hypothetical protein
MINFVTDNWEIVLGLLGAFGGAFSFLVNSKAKAKTSANDLLERHIDRIQKELDNARNLAQTRGDMLAAAQLQLAVERVKGGSDPILVVKQLVHSFPGLFWCKRRIDDKIFVMIAVSKEYARFYLGMPTHEYEDKRDSEIYDNDRGDSFNDNDEEAYRTQLLVEVRENIGVAPSGVTGFFTGYKWCIMLDDGTALIFGYGTHEQL